jgi:F-type H+-transporting ATPase subunit alpha
MRSVAGRLRVDLAQYRELEAFAAFGSDLDRASQQQLARGARLVELLKQPAASPFPVGREIVSIWAGTTGKLDDIEVSDIRRFEQELLDYVQHNAEGLYDELASTKQFTDEHTERLEQLVNEFKKQFQPSNPQEGGGSSRGSDKDERSSRGDESASDEKSDSNDDSES